MLEPPKFRYQFNADDDVARILTEFKALRAMVERLDYMVQQQSEMIALLTDIKFQTVNLPSAD